MREKPSPALVEAIGQSMQRDLDDIPAKKYVEDAKKHRTPPQVIYRCGEGCGLLKVWQTKAGLVMGHIGVRQGRTRSRQLPNPGGLRLGHSTGSTLKLAPRAYVLDDRPIELTCEHRSEVFDRAELLADVAEALTTRRTIKRTRPVK